jgi:hypothetical protein
MPQRAQLCDELSDHFGRQACDPPVVDDRRTSPVPHHTTMIDDQEPDTSPPAVHEFVTDVPEHRPAGHPYRFYQLHDHRLERIRTSFQRVCAAQQAAARSLPAAAPGIGMDTSRAVLDAAAHRHITARTWAPVPAQVPAPDSAVRGTIARGHVVSAPAALGRGTRL